MENQIRAWLKVDIMEGYLNRPKDITNYGEGGTLSPLLSNIAMHGMETYIKEWYANNSYPTTDKLSTVGKRDRKNTIEVIRYAYDFVITAPDLQYIKAIEGQVTNWLENEAGLPFAKAKTKIINSVHGFEFLGFHIISIKNNEGKYKIKIHPSKESKAQILQSTRKVIQENRSASSYNLIHQLEPKIIGWANYFRFSECSKDFAKIDYIIYNQIRAWVFRRKSKGLRSRIKIKLKYFPEGKTYIFQEKEYKNNWILTGQTLGKNGEIKENFLPKLVWVSSAQHIKIKENASPYNGNHLDWSKRVEKYSGFRTRVS
jgi:RNA-directed DNA polymerase